MAARRHRADALIAKAALTKRTQPIFTPLALRDLLRDLRSDLEEDLSRVIGDAAAHRLGQAARSFSRWQRDARARLIENLLEYAIDERQLLPKRGELSVLSGEIEELARALARLEARVALLDRGGDHPAAR